MTLKIKNDVNSTSLSHQSYHCGMLLWCQMTNKDTVNRVQRLICFVRQVRNGSVSRGHNFVHEEYFFPCNFFSDVNVFKSFTVQRGGGVRE